MNHSPLVSIIITAHVPVWLEGSLKSALAQDYPHCEILVSDTSGKQFIGQRLQPYLNQPGHTVRHLIFPAGYSTALAEAIHSAQGKYIKLLSFADQLAPQCVSTMVQVLESLPQAVLAVSKRKRLDAGGEDVADTLSTAAFLPQPGLVKGTDLLRYQCRLSYNLIGDLSATLIRRECLLALMPEPEALFTLENETLAPAGALVLYSKLLAQGDAVWFPTPLCAVRVSDVHPQPHQIEDDEPARTSRERVIQFLRQASWQSSAKGPSELISVAPLSQPAAFTQHNVRQLQYHALSLSTLFHWNAVRSLKPVHQAALQQLSDRSPQPASLAIIIIVTPENVEQLNDTLTSLSDFSSPLLVLTPLLVGEVTDNTQGAPAWPASAESRLAIINQLIAEQTYTWLMCVEAGTRFNLSGLMALSTTLPSRDDVLALYADEYFYIEQQPAGLAFRPDFNLDMLLSSPKSMARHWLFRRELLLAAEGFDINFNQSAELDLIVKLIESQGLNVVGHLAEPLLTAHLRPRDIAQDAQIIQRHLHNRGYAEAEIALDGYYNYRLRYNHADQPKVSIIILAGESLAALITCVTTLMEKTRYQHYELMIVADNQRSQERDNWLEAIATVDVERIRVVRYDGEWHQGAMANLAAEHAQGEYLMFLHSELAITDGEWLANLLNHAQRPEVAIVGGKQLSADNKVRHAGFVLGVNGIAGDVFRGQDDKAPSALGRLHLDQNYSAVSGDFMLVRFTVFAALNGFDETLTLFTDVDLCLRARNQGYLTVWTPYARVLRAADRKRPFAGVSIQAAARLKQQEEDLLLQRWLPLVGRDPAYNTNLSQRGRHFDISNDSEMCWQPVRSAGLPQLLLHHSDTAGCGHYRMLQPLHAMQMEGKAQGNASLSLLNLSEVAQYRPDSLIIQRRYAPAFHTWIERAGKIPEMFKVFELDDYILNLPMKHYNRANFRQEVSGHLRKSLSYFDRFVVSTQPLAEALSSFHPDIQVVLNRLPVNWWGGLHSLRGQGRKPRVGWAGGSSHQGDLEMIADVVKALANEVEWVFMGMCPEKLRPYVHEHHSGVDISLYPATLAALNLDLALAPVEDNIFNDCKSNLRLMEYGACGIPVVCSDVQCYRHTNLPVTRVKNRFKDWVDAIRMHLNDLNESERTGLALQRQVREEWMLKGTHVDNWLKAWSA
ncbi:glycosyltransferase [Pantoea phytobeneficialis]|uniref:Glycosyltransferase n=1 Tax=Pantoea phytobeneficialis TaxID=2052056 RepID=A0AAP9H7F0_9GAMM|nr:glycosyltransferase [Pantoea phytobeneficialis]MDO6408877.1 glycosyltransferase [Pantoea phytobeneficialis]QGR07988.1 O-antigen biosynthesis protein [Pantoea phytobeneficialis]